MALNGTPWHFERLAVNVDGIGEVISHKSLDWDFEIGGEQATDRQGNPRGTIRGIYKGTAKIELATQEAFDFSDCPIGRGRRRDHGHVQLRAHRGRLQVTDAVPSAQQR